MRLEVAAAVLASVVITGCSDSRPKDAAADRATDPLYWTRAPGTLSVPRAQLQLNALAADCGRPGRTLGLRLTAPLPPGGTVEVVRTAVVSDDAVSTVEELLDETGLRRVAVGTRPGVHADQLVYAFLNRAAMLYESGYATAHSIDTAMRLGCGLPSGPLEFLDRVGIDTAYAVLTAEHQRWGRACFAPAAVLSAPVAPFTPLAAVPPRISPGSPPLLLVTLRI